MPDDVQLTPQAERRPTACNCLALRQAARHVSQFYDAALAPFGLRTTQLSILVRLDRSRPWSIHALAAALVMDRTTLGRSLQPLLREGLVATQPDPNDRRSRAVTITPAGRDRLRNAVPAWERAQRAFDARFGADRASGLRDLLGEVAATPFDAEPIVTDPIVPA